LPLDDAALAEVEGEWLAAVDRAIELGAVRQLASVVRLDVSALSRNVRGVGSLGEHELRQARRDLDRLDEVARGVPEGGERVAGRGGPRKGQDGERGERGDAEQLLREGPEGAGSRREFSVSQRAFSVRKGGRRHAPFCAG
jgi:hypothetical protein